MASTASLRRFTLLQKEIQEYKLSFVWTPVIVAVVLTLLMFASVLVAGRISAMGDTILEVIMAEKTNVSPIITINIDDTEITSGDSSAAEPVYEVEVASADDAPSEEDWNFSRSWRFEPEKRDKPDYESSDVGSLNPVLNVINGFFLLLGIWVTTSYLLGSLYNDRKDRSILFWKSMPVSEWEEVLTRFIVALVVVPALYIGVSILLQLSFVLLAMLMVWRMDMDPFVTVLANIRFGDLLLDQVGGWLMTALWVAPVYGWFLLASAWAKRAPFIVAVAPVIGIMLLEGFLLGTDYVYAAVISHIPHYVGGESVVGFYINGVFWQEVDLFSMFCGLVFAAITLIGSIYLRRYRFDI
jgi:ABC-2 type transport system permease protein